MLQNLADMYPELNKRFKVDPPEMVSRTAASLHMLYNQVIRFNLSDDCRINLLSVHHRCDPTCALMPSRK